MPSGNLGSARLAAAAPALLYAVPPDTLATATVCFCNAGEEAANVSLAVSGRPVFDAGAVIWLEFQQPLDAIGGMLERSGIALSPGESLFAISDLAGVHVRAHGFTEEA